MAKAGEAETFHVANLGNYKQVYLHSMSCLKYGNSDLTESSGHHLMIS